MANSGSLVVLRTPGAGVANGGNSLNYGYGEDAIKAMDKAIQIKSGAELLTYRALFKRSLKKNDEAKSFVKILTETAPGSDEAKKAKKLFK